MLLILIVDCTWSPFSNWTECSMTCGGGQRMTSRTISQPALYGGKNCIGDAFKTEKCNTKPCPGTNYFKEI